MHETRIPPIGPNAEAFLVPFVTALVPSAVGTAYPAGIDPNAGYLGL